MGELKGMALGAIASAMVILMIQNKDMLKKHEKNYHQ